MTTPGRRSAELAARWIESWETMDLDWLRAHLAPDFVHTSPFGRLEGRDHYLATVEPMARKSVRSLEVRHVVSTGDRAAIWFQNETPEGVIESCDWVRVEGDTIVEITSFYDSAAVRKVLSPSEQTDLGGSAQGPADRPRRAGAPPDRTAEGPPRPERRSPSPASH